MEVDRDAIDDKDDEEWKPEDAAVGKDGGTKVKAEETSCQVVYNMPDGSLHEYELFRDPPKSHHPTKLTFPKLLSYLRLVPYTTNLATLNLVIHLLFPTN